MQTDDPRRWLLVLVSTAISLLWTTAGHAQTDRKKAGEYVAYLLESSGLARAT